MHKLKAFIEKRKRYRIVSFLLQLHARIFSTIFYTKAEVDELIDKDLELCTIHFYYTAKGVVGATKTPKVESIFAWVNLSRSTKEDCIHLFKLPTCDNSRITIKDVVIVPVPKVRYSK